MRYSFQSDIRLVRSSTNERVLPIYGGYDAQPADDLVKLTANYNLADGLDDVGRATTVLARRTHPEHSR